MAQTTIQGSFLGDATVTGAKIGADFISAQTALTSGLATTDEIIVSDAGVIKRMDISVLEIAATQITANGTLPALNGSALTNLTSGNLTGALPAIDGAALTSLTAANITASGTLPALNGAALTALNGTQITTGTLPAARIANDSIVEAKLDVSNAPTDGLFLQAQSGEGGGLTCAAASAGISGHGTVVIKSSDQTVNNSTTLVNDDTLVWALAANKNYRLWAHAFIDTHIHSDFKWTFTGPTGCEIHLTVNRNYAAGASYDWHGLNSLGTVVSMGTPTDTASNWEWFGTIMNGGNAGNLQLHWAQNAAQSFDTKMHNGSWGIVELLN